MIRSFIEGAAMPRTTMARGPAEHRGAGQKTSVASAILRVRCTVRLRPFVGDQLNRVHELASAQLFSFHGFIFHGVYLHWVAMNNILGVHPVPFPDHISCRIEHNKAAPENVTIQAFHRVSSTTAE